MEIKTKSSLIRQAVHFVARLELLLPHVIRAGLVIVTLWIGGLKITKYEAEGIVPFVANSPFFRWMLRDPNNYKTHKIPEGTVNSINQQWHEMNHTYPVALFIGGTIVLIGLLIAIGWKWPILGVLGGLLLVGMSFVTLSFLITTPEVWVPNLGTSTHGFPYLAGPGRLVIKDVIMLGAALYTAVESAKRFINK